MTNSCHARIQEVERLADQLNHLLKHQPGSLTNEGADLHAHHLVQWGNNYRDGLRYGTVEDDRPANHGTAWLAGLSDRLMLESEELNRSEPVTDDDDEPVSEIEDFIASARWVIRAATDGNRTLTIDASVGQELPKNRPNKYASSSLVRDLMKRNPVIIPPDFSLKEAAQEMEVINCGILPVGTADKVIGIITDRDIVLRAVAKGKDVNKEKVSTYMTPEVCSVQEDDGASEAADLMRIRNVNRLLVSDAVGRPRGIITMGRIIRENKILDEMSNLLECAAGRRFA